jgi:hypothetical protein
MPDFSDTSEFEAIATAMAIANPLNAVERPLDAYSPCWCGSGRKWKFCHKDREKAKVINFGQRSQEFSQLLRTGPCLHPKASPAVCSDSRAISSHTIQRRGGLAAIAEKGHVYSIKRAFFDIAKNDGQVGLKLWGLNDASTFPGFCNLHDTTLFKPVELPDSKLDAWNAFLLSYRAICYELTTKKAHLRALYDMRDTGDNGAPFAKQRAIQNLLWTQLNGVKRGEADVTVWKNQYDEDLQAGSLSDFHFYGLAFPCVLPFVASGGFMPEFDYSGNRLQSLGTSALSEHVAFNVTVLGGVSVAVLGWKGKADGAAQRFVSSFASLPEKEQADALLLTACEHLENTYFKPSWWDSLSQPNRDVLDKAMGSGTPYREADALTARGLGVFAVLPSSVLDCR